MTSAVCATPQRDDVRVNEHDPSPPAGIPGWRRARCLGCGKDVKAHRHHHVTFIGTTDGSALLAGPVWPELVLGTAEVLGRDDLLMLGVAHRSCMDSARAAVEAGSLRDRPPSDFPPVSATESLTESKLDEPPDGGSCPFCGRQGKMTDEDIWPMWFWAQLRHAGAGYRGKEPRVTTPVCDECNSRWMSVIENDAAAVVKRMFRERVYESREVVGFA